MLRLLSISFLLCSLVGFTNSDKYVVDKQLDYLWMDYNEEIGSFVPFEKALFTNKKVAHLQLKKVKPSEYLVFQNISETQLFIGNKLFRVYINDGECVIPLREIISFVKEESPVLTFFNAKGELPIVNIFIGIERSGDLKKAERYQVLSKNKISQVPIILFLLFSGGILAFIKTSKPVTYKAYFDLGMHFKNIEEHIIFNSFSKTAMLLPIIIAILIGVSLNLFGYSFFTEGSYLSSWVRLGLDIMVIMVFLFLKFFLLGLLSWVLSLRGMRRLHFFEFVRVGAQYAVFLFILAVVNFDTGFAGNHSLIILSVIFFVVLTVKLFFSLNRVHKFSNLFFLFYFCSTEVFPLFVLAKQLT